MSELHQRERPDWGSRYHDLGKGTAPISIDPSPFEQAMAVYGREKRRALYTLLGSASTVFLLFALTFFGLGRWSVPDANRLVREPSLPSSEQAAWEAKIADLKAQNIDLRLAVVDKEAAIEDLGKLIWTWVEKERRRGIETEIPLEIGKQIPPAAAPAASELATLGADTTAARP